jgi:hypothetical protein
MAKRARLGLLSLVLSRTSAGKVAAEAPSGAFVAFGGWLNNFIISNGELITFFNDCQSKLLTEGNLL